MELITELGRIIGSQGPWAAACVCVFIILVWTVKQWVDAERRCYTSNTELQEKRVQEKESTVIALRSGNETNLKLSDALSANTDAILNHTRLTLEMAANMRADQDHWKFRATGWEAASAELKDTLGAIRLIVAKIDR